MLLEKFVSNPTVNSTMYRMLCTDCKRRSGLRSLPVILLGDGKLGRSAKREAPFIALREKARKFGTK